MLRRQSPTRIPGLVAFCLLIAFMAASVPAQTDCCVGRVGDANGEGGDEPTIGDVARIIEAAFLLIYPPEDICFAEWDVNQSGGADPGWGDISIGDISMLIDYLFISGSLLELPYCPGHQGAPYGYVYDLSGCKSAQGAAASGQTCLNWSYDGQGVLSLTHLDGALNCCPIPTLTVDLVGDTIFVSESDSGLCDCRCLYDIEYRVADLPPGDYRIVVAEAYEGGGEPLDFWVDLAEAPAGEHCVERPQYPWGTVPSGTLVERSACLSHAAAAAVTSAYQTCVLWQYDGVGTLTVTHGNAGFNCCPTSVTAAFSFQGSTITIIEIEKLTNPCTCDCLYNLDFEINDLPPGQYRIVFVEPYRTDPDPALDFMVDLSQPVSNGMHCVPRNNYPWGMK